MQILWVAVMVFLMFVVSVPVASAQTDPQPAPAAGVWPTGVWLDRGFLNINAAMQPASRTFDTRGRFRLYEEEGSFEVRHGVDGGGVLDVSAGARVWRNLGVGLGFSRFSDRADVAIAAQVPHPVLFNEPRSASTQATGLRHRERSVHLFALWMFPLRYRLDAAVSFGPSFFSVHQDVVTGVQVAEVGLPLTSVDIPSVGLTRERDSATGLNAGVDVTYLLTPHVGAGGFLRFAGASIDISSPDGSRTTLRVGGFQAGFGIRTRF